MLRVRRSVKDFDGIRFQRTEIGAEDGREWPYIELDPLDETLPPVTVERVGLRTWQITDYRGYESGFAAWRIYRRFGTEDDALAVAVRRIRRTDQGGMPCTRT